MPGYAAYCIQAAVWRESMDPVLKDVCSAKDADTAACNGPDFRRALFGRRLIFTLDSEDGGINHYTDILEQPQESWRADMAKWDKLSEETREALSAGTKEEIGIRSARKSQLGETRN